MSDYFAGGETNSVDYWNKRFFEDWIAKGGREQTGFFAELCCRELPQWFVADICSRQLSIFDYGCALGDALPVLQRQFPDSAISGGDVAQVGLGLARALHPDFEFADVNACGDKAKIADVVYCSNTLEHSEQWRDILDLLGRYAAEYVIVVVPFEEEDRIDEHVCTFEFDSLPPRLRPAMRLLHLAVVDAEQEPETQWRGKQLIAIYGKKRSSGDRPVEPAARQPKRSPHFDLSGVKPRVLPALLANLARMSQEHRRTARELAAAHQLAALHAQTAEQVRGDAAALKAILREYADLTRGAEAAQRWLLDQLDPALIQERAVSAVPDGWPTDDDDDPAAQRVTLARQVAVIDRANRLGLAFHEQAVGWLTERAWLRDELETAHTDREQAIARHAQTIEQVRAQAAMLKAILRECAELTRGAERAQRWLLGRLDHALIGEQRISAVPEGWPADDADNEAAGRLTLARLGVVIDRANRLGLAFHERAAEWRLPPAQARHVLERVVGERDRALGRVRALRETADRVPPDEGADRLPPLVSIVLPVYNQAGLVGHAIAGIVAQTYRHWELIVVDDGSTDDLDATIRKHVGDRRILFLRQPNQKLPAALNHGFSFARGELLTWTSADNVMLPTQIERLAEELIAHPEIGLVYSDYWAIDDCGLPLAEPGWRTHNRDPEIADLIRLPPAVTIENFHRSGDNFIGASFLYRRAVADLVGGYADDAFGGEDYDFWLRMHLVTEFRHVAEPLYKYRVHANTLTSRAAELGLHANIQEVLAADRWRLDTLLAEGALHRDGSMLRPAGQFHAAILERCRPIACRDVVVPAPAAMPGTPIVVDIDVPLRSIDAAALRQADILLCRSRLTARVLRREAWARGKRILDWSGGLTPAIEHAFVQAFADRVTAPLTTPAGRVPPRIDDPFCPDRILLVVERWSSGGLENVVVDLAQSLAASGRTVFVASAEGAPPPADAFAGAPIRTVSFGGSEDAFDTLLRRETIEVVNYHHSCFAVGCAKNHAVATVYTMHNCYLWMNDAARQAVAAGIAQMDRVIAVSRQVAQFAVAPLCCPEERIVVVPNGLRDEIIGAAAQPRLDVSSFTVAMVGSFTRLKLQHVAIAAFAEVAREVPEMRLRLIGATLDETYGETLRAQIAASPQGHRIEMVTGLGRSEAVAELAAAHVFILPSLVEGCSMALLEAVAAGCVCIVSDVGSARDLQTAHGSIVLLPSPLGELDWVTQRQFLEAAAAELPEHRENLAQGLRTAWRDYGSLAAGATQTRARLRELHGMEEMTAGYLLTYAMAYRAGTSSSPERARRSPTTTEAAASVAAPA